MDKPDHSPDPAMPVSVLEDCNRHLHDVGHRAGGIVMASRILHAGGQVPSEILESYQLLKRVVAGSDEVLRVAREARELMHSRPR